MLLKAIRGGPSVPTGRGIAFGAGAIGVVNIIKAVVQILMLPLMAHLLSPAAFGLYALALPAVSLLSMLADGGLGASLSREPEAAPVWSTAFWILQAAGIGLAAALTGWGVALGVITHEPRLPPLMAVLSLSLILLTLCVCPTARLTRQGRLGVGAGADLVGTLAGAAAGLLLADRGAGVFSLAAQYVLAFAVRAAILNAAAFHRPRLELRLGLLRGHLGTSGSLIGARLADFAGRMAENTIFGWTLGTTPLGLYNFSNQLSRFLCEAAGNPIWSALYVQALRGDSAALAALHAQMCRLLGIILFPATALVVAAAPELIPHLLGAKWAAAAPLIQIMLPFYVCNAISSQSGAILLAYGRFDLQFFGILALSLAKVAAVCTAPWTGLLGVAWGVAAANGLYAVAMLIIPAKISGCRPLPVLRGLRGPFAASLLAAAASGAYLGHVTYSRSTLLLALLFGAVVFIAGILVIDRTRVRMDLLAIARIVKSVGGARGEAAQLL